MNNEVSLVQAFSQTYERSLHHIRKIERLSLEASIEELCKMILLQVYYERKNGYLSCRDVTDMVLSDDNVRTFYQLYFDSFFNGTDFKGWDNLKLGVTSFSMVWEELTHDIIIESDTISRAKAFSTFLQLHYSGYLSEYSTPQLLCKYIIGVVSFGNAFSIVDPCCGLGGLLVEAIRSNNTPIKVRGYDVNQRMVNTANLHLMLYGKEVGAAKYLDVLEMASVYREELFDVVVGHLPLRQSGVIAASTARGTKKWNSPMRQEDIFISQILKMLKPNGIAALVVSDDLLMSELRVASREWLNMNAQIVNITRFDGLTFLGSSTVRSYNVIFIKKEDNALSDICLATHIKLDSGEKEIEQAAYDVKTAIFQNRTNPPLGENNVYFRLLEEESWNVNLLFAREKMGVIYPTCMLRDILVHERNRVKVYDNHAYKQLSVRQKGLGVVERKEVFIGKINSKNDRYVARSGQIIMSSLDIDKGAVGIVPKHLDKALVSKNYYLFTITRSDVFPDYLVMVLSSEPVLRQLAFYKRSPGWSRISLSKLESLVIPLPSLQDQKRLVGNLMNKVNKIQKLQEELESEHEEFASKLFGK